MEQSGAKPVTEGRTPVLNRQIKDTVFSDLFGDKTRLLQLYHALHPEDDAVSEDDIDNVTAKNILIRDLYNDLGFTVRGKLLLLVEAQSTWTVNVVLRLFLYLAETWGEYIKATAQNIYSTKKVVLPVTECYVVFTGDRKDKPSVISMFDEFVAPHGQSLPSLELPADERMLDLKVRVIFASEVSDIGSEGNGCECGGASAESMDILQQYIAFSKECDRQFAQKGRTVEALTCAIEICKRKNILREYLEAREKEVIKIMTMLFDQGWANEIALKESEARGEARGEVRGEARGVFKTLYELVNDNLLSLGNAASKAGQSEEEFAAGMKEYFGQVPVIN